MVAGLIQRWRGWLTFGAISAAAIGGAVLAPPAALGATASSRAYAAVASGAFTALALLPVILGRPRLHRAVALGSAASLLLFGLGAFYYASAQQQRCTVQYNGRPVLIGTELTALGLDHQRRYPDETAVDLLESSLGDPSKAWTRESIDGCRTRIASTYFLWLPLLVGSLVSAALTVPGGRFSVPMMAPSTIAAQAVPARYDVFISYRHGGADGDVARRLLQALEADGYTVAIDERDFPANASFLQEMERCIRESRYTVAIVSARYLESGNCEEEAIVCKVLDMGERRRRLIPFIIQAVPMPAWLFGIVGVDCTRPDPLIDPIEKLKATIGPPLAPATRSAV